MGFRNARLWVVAIALAFLAVWCASVNVAYADPGPGQEVADEPAVVSSQIEKVGIAGWCVVGVGFLGVAVTAFLSCRPKRHSRVRKPYSASGGSHRKANSNPLYSPTPAHRYVRMAERRR